MKPPISKKIKKVLKQHFTLIMIPNSSNQTIRNYRIPFIMMLGIFILVVFNVYIFLAYSTQIGLITHFKQKLSAQNKTIAKLTAEKSLVIPVLNKSRDFEVELARYRQEDQKMYDTWKRVRRKANLRFTLASRGLFDRGKVNSYNLTPISKPNTVITSLDQLDHNMDQLAPILEKEIEEQKQLFQDLEAYERHLDHTPSIWPVYSRISSPFGRRFHPIYRKYITHEGIDLSAKYGTKVRAAADGVVSFAGWSEGYGLMVKVNHDYGYETRYGHNSELLVSNGKTVKKGQIIAISGNTGESTGPHLHYEVRVNGNPVNPMPFLKE